MSNANGMNVSASLVKTSKVKMERSGTERKHLSRNER